MKVQMHILVILLLGVNLMLIQLCNGSAPKSPCPSSGGSVCSESKNQGACNLKLKTPKCTCRPGFYGSACEKAATIGDCDFYDTMDAYITTAYKTNAKCACSIKYPEEDLYEPSVGYKCIRKFLQTRLSDERYWPISRLMELHILSEQGIIQLEQYWKSQLYMDIHRDHVDAFNQCGCLKEPSPLWTWKLVVVVPIPICSIEHILIDIMNPCILPFTARIDQN
jgi:hypothetical protein